MLGKLGEKFALMDVRGQVADQGALRRVSAKLLQMRQHVLHFFTPQPFSANGRRRGTQRQ